MHKVKFLIFATAILLIWYLGKFSYIDTKALETSFKEFPPLYSGIIFIISYVIVTFFIWLSKDVFRFMAAVVFGAYLSTLLIWIAETINAFILFYLARSLGRDFVERSLKASTINLDGRLGRVTFFWLFMFRATPLLAFRFLDLGAGLTKISFKKYLAAVVLGSPLRIFWLQYILAGVGKSLFSRPGALTEYLLAHKAILYSSFIYIVLVVLVASKLKIKD